MSVVDSKSLEIWVQNGIPDGGQLVYNVYIRNLSSNEWEITHKLGSFAHLDIEINKRTDALRDVGFPIINKDTLRTLVGPGKNKNKAIDLETYRALIEQWVYCIISRIETFPPELQDIVEEFFQLPDGPTSNQSLQNVENGDDIDDNQTENEDCESAGRSTIGDESQVSSNELPTKKKKRRVVKGIKKRVNKLFLGSLNGTASSISGDRDNLTHVSDPRDSKSTYESSSGRASEPSVISSVYGDDFDKIHQVQPTTLILSRVQRGGERSRGVYIYEIQLIYHPEKKPFQISHLFSDFVSLNQQLVNSSNVKITSTFPPTLKKESIGIVLTEGEHAERTRLLDCWIKDVLYSYQAMNQLQQHAVKVFLGLNRELQKTYQIQDKLSKGQVEAPRATATIGIASRGSSLSESVTHTPPRTPRSIAGSGVGGDNSDFSESIGTPPTLIIPSGNSSGNGISNSSASPSRPPLSRRSSAPVTSFTSSEFKTTEQRKIAYRVKIGSVGSTVIDSPKSIVIPSKLNESNDNNNNNNNNDNNNNNQSKQTLSRTNTANSETVQTILNTQENAKSTKNPLIRINTKDDIKFETINNHHSENTTKKEYNDINNNSNNNEDDDDKTTTKCSCIII